jgi:hypothetical protein
MIYNRFIDCFILTAVHSLASVGVRNNKIGVASGFVEKEKSVLHSLRMTTNRRNYLNVE